MIPVEKQEVIDEVFHSVAEVAPHISSGLLHRREYVEEENPSDEKSVIECGEGLSVTVDPLDGSSNIPTNNLVGTIVGIYDGELPCNGENLVSAFYIVFGPMISIMRSDGEEVNEYVIEETAGDQVEVHLASEDIELPEPYVYGFGGNKNWTEEFREFEDEISEDLKLRYGGAFVGDINQTIHYGGIFGYPHRTDAPEGKYRLMFECNPVAFIVEAAGGSSTNTKDSILEVDAEELHQREPFFAGNEELVKEVESRF